MMAAELGAERLVDLGKHLARGAKIRRQRLAHADRLAALARKYESDRHALGLCPSLDTSPRELFCARGAWKSGRKTPRYGVLSS